MPPVQTSYGSEQAVAALGMLADSGENDIVSRAAEEDIPFGAAVVAGTIAGKQVMLPTAAGDATEIFEGVAVFTHSEAGVDEPNPGYPEESAVNVCKVGRIWVKVSSAVAYGAVAYADHVNEDGRFTDVATDNGSAVGIFKSAQANVDGLAILELNLP